MNTGFYTNPIYLEHDTGGHPENAARLKAILSLLESEDLLKQFQVRSGRQARRDEVLMLHSPALVSEVESASKSGARALHTPDCIVSCRTFDAAMHAVGTVLEAVLEVAERRLDNAFCALRPPGHHAERGQAMGFCFFNNVALAAEFLSRQLGYRRVLIFDFDVHHGNGTQHLFEERDDVFYVSIHQDPRTCYPGSGFAGEKGKGHGKGFTLNVPIPAYTADLAYLDLFSHQVLPQLIEYAPDFVLVSAGFDAHLADPLASLNLTETSFHTLITELKRLAEISAGGRILSLLEGGYDLDALSACVRDHLLVLKSDS